MVFLSHQTFVKEDFHTIKHPSVEALSSAQSFFWARYDYVCCRSKVRNNVKHLNVGLLNV